MKRKAGFARGRALQECVGRPGDCGFRVHSTIFLPSIFLPQIRIQPLGDRGRKIEGKKMKGKAGFDRGKA